LSKGDEAKEEDGGTGKGRFLLAVIFEQAARLGNSFQERLRKHESDGRVGGAKAENST